MLPCELIFQLYIYDGRIKNISSPDINTEYLNVKFLFKIYKKIFPLYFYY